MYYVLFKLKNKGTTIEKVLLPIPFDHQTFFNYLKNFYEDKYISEIDPNTINIIVNVVEHTAETLEPMKGFYKDFKYKSEIIDVLD